MTSFVKWPKLLVWHVERPMADGRTPRARRDGSTECGLLVTSEVLRLNREPKPTRVVRGGKTQRSLPRFCAMCIRKSVSPRMKDADSMRRQRDDVIDAEFEGECRFCRCTEDNACDGGCTWADSTRTLCSECQAAAVRLSELPPRAFSEMLGLIAVMQGVFTAHALPRRRKRPRTRGAQRDTPRAK